MTFSEYQDAARRTMPTPEQLLAHVAATVHPQVRQMGALGPLLAELARRENLHAAALGVTGEAGEVADLVKKHLHHGHPLDVAKVVEECGDAMWGLSRMLDAVGVTMEDAAAANVEKLRRRYPDGFSEARSRNR